MTSNRILWENRLTRLAFVLLALGVVYGIVAGAAVTMYYDLTPDMGRREDSLGSVQQILFLLAVLIGFTHLPFAVWDLMHGLWRQASMRALVIFGPIVVFLGTEGLISHYLWWGPISDTDRYHLLHHTVIAGLPLLLCYWLALRFWWQPEAILAGPSPSRRILLVSGLALIWIAMAFGIVAGMVTPPAFVAAIILGLIAIPVIWLMPARQSSRG
ncbi:MAG TPA: hypothetical protein VJ768_09025 [Anaerolineales bacterium]|nr:hypothetical protein [Anaerolineales bacterium]